MKQTWAEVLPLYFCNASDGGGGGIAQTTEVKQPSFFYQVIGIKLSLLQGGFSYSTLGLVNC